MQKSLDVFAISVSGMCAVHCLLTPVMLILFPLLTGTLLASEEFHRFLLWVIFPTSALAVLLGCKRHKDPGVFLLGSAGLAMLLLAGFWAHDMVGEFGERLLTLAGSALLISGHFRNYRLCKKNRCHC